MIFVGTSGWQYRDWAGRVYPRGLPSGRWLERYTGLFPTVELNASFYRLPSTNAFEAWRHRTPDGFVMAVKASRYLTHMRRLVDPRDPVALLWSRARHLGPRLGPVLFQLPPSFELDLDRLQGLLEVLPRGMRPAVEVRHRSWLDDRVFDLLDRHGAAFVLADRPGARVPSIVTGGWTYIRFHQGTRRSAGYRPDKLRRWADRIAAFPAGGVFVYFNNDPGAAAVRDAQTLNRLLCDRGCRVARPSTDAVTPVPVSAPRERTEGRARRHAEDRVSGPVLP
jgi:uncharacterized protein YecE (DUF72 family)